MRRVFALIAALVVTGSLAAQVALGAMVLPPTREGVAVYDLAGIWSDATEAQAQSIADQIRARTQALSGAGCVRRLSRACHVAPPLWLRTSSLM